MIATFIIALVVYDLLKLFFSSMIKTWLKSKNAEAWEAAVRDKKEADSKWEKRYREMMDAPNK